MASLSENSKFASKNDIAVHGYVRENFEDNCWVQEIIQIIIHFYFCNSGSLYVCGNGDRLGIEEYRNKMCKKLTVCPPFDQFNALDVSAGTNHTLILDIDGQVWSYGQGHSGQLGNGEAESIYTPEKLSLIQPAFAVAAGEYHSLILLKNGTVKSFGQGKCGQLGHGNEDSLYAPKTIKALQHMKIMQIAAGASYSACLSDNGELFCFGDNIDGVCGVRKDVGEYIFTPTKVEFDKKVAFFKCGAYHTLLLANNYLPYSFGVGKDGQLGHGDEEKVKYVPTLIEALKHVKLQSFAAGSYHSTCVDVSGTVWNFGSNTDGECGLEKEIENQWTPKVNEYFVVNKIKAVDCAAGGYQSCIWSENGDLYVFGCNRFHQLGLEETNHRTPTKLSLPQNMRVKKISMSCLHSAFILG